MKWNLPAQSRRLGFRIIKTGIAVTLCVLVSSLLQLNSPFYTVIAAIIAMGKSIDSSFKAGKNRMIGTFIGALTGMCFAMLQPGNLGLCGVGIIITLYLCHAFHLHDSANIACIVFSAIMLNLKDAVPWIYAVNRIFDTFIGILIALLVNLLIMPPNMAGQIRKSYLQLCALLKKSAQQAVEGGAIDFRAIELEMARLDAAQRQYVQEAKLLRGRDEEIFFLLCRQRLLREVLHELNAVELLRDKATSSPELEPVYVYHTKRLDELMAEILLEKPKNTEKKQEPYLP